MSHNYKINKFVSLLLYAIPIIFFAVCYYLMTVTGEDIFQGAQTKTDYLTRALEAFKYNSRLSDMYAWSVIRAFDFQFCFGVDTIFRAIDVMLATGIMYMISYIALGRRLKLIWSDAAVFCLVFCAIAFNNTCESLYLAFSHIHNYLIIGFFSMMFFVPYARYAAGLSVPKRQSFRILSFAAGFLFGFSSNITPIAFLITVFLCFCAQIIYSHKTKIKTDYKNIVSTWQAFSVYGILTACLLMYTMGSGVSAYLNDSYARLTGYIAFADIFSQPGVYIPKVINNIYLNFKEMAPCLLLMSMALGYELVMYKKQPGVSKAPVLFSAYTLIFVAMHILVMSQLRISMTLRLIMPAYFVCIASLCYAGIRIMRQIKCTNTIAMLICICLVTVSGTAVYDMAKAKYQYTCQIRQVINNIDSSTSNTVYIPYSENIFKPSDIFSFNQYNFLQEWVIAEKTVRGKQIFFDYSK